jgi:type IV pilus assembly protein PilX
MPSRQRGAALVIGLMLLVVLTLLAVTGMNTASTELVMAGNEQYRQRAFHASEAGIEQGVALLPTAEQKCEPKQLVKQKQPGTNDEYTVISQYAGEGTTPEDSSIGKFTEFHYELRSTATSVRNAKAVHVQGAYIAQNTGGGVYASGCGSPVGIVPQP